MTSKDASSQDMRGFVRTLRMAADAHHQTSRGATGDLLSEAAAVIEAALSTTPDIVEPPLRGLKEEVALMRDALVIAYKNLNMIGRHFDQCDMYPCTCGLNEVQEQVRIALQASETSGSPTLHPDTKSKIDELQALGSGGLK